MYKSLTCLGEGNQHEGRGSAVTKQSKLAATPQFFFSSFLEVIRLPDEWLPHPPPTGLHFVQFLATEGYVA